MTGERRSLATDLREAMVATQDALIQARQALTLGDIDRLEEQLAGVADSANEAHAVALHIIQELNARTQAKVMPSA